MAVIVLASASGAPGVTTTALGLALVWPRPVVLVDADPVGGSAILAGFCKGTEPHNDAMIRLALAHRLFQRQPGQRLFGGGGRLGHQFIARTGIATGPSHTRPREWLAACSWRAIGPVWPQWSGRSGPEFAG